MVGHRQDFYVGGNLVWPKVTGRDPVIGGSNPPRPTILPGRARDELVVL